MRVEGFIFIPTTTEADAEKLKKSRQNKILFIMEKLELYQMEKLEGGEVDVINAIGCAAGIAMVAASAGVNIFAFAAGVLAIEMYCGGVFPQ